jgi:hypothetical protein
VIESPCRNICRIDAASGWCLGCGRSLAEVGDWMRLTPGQRRQVMQQLPERLALLATPPQAQPQDLNR